MTTAQVRQAAFIVALGVGVTVGGVAAGALVLAPAVAGATQPGVGASLTRSIDAGFGAVRSVTAAPTKAMTARWMALPASFRRLALPVLLGSLAVSGFAATGVSLLRRRPAVRLPSASDTLASVSAIWGGAGLSVARTGGRATARANNRPIGRGTPRAVQALADSGTEAGEIARRTGLSLDAVAMLLSIGSGSRQLRPPTA